ncbi:MAG: LytTR family transcriptional regulator [Marinicaulis sp.]|nr:LytTR family transcriptional regulator [Marinicaulis sp.]
MDLLRKYFIHGLAGAIALGWIFSFLGVYDTNALPFFKRFVFWTSTMIVGSFGSALAGIFLWRTSLREKPPVLIAAVAALTSFPVLLVLAGYDNSLNFRTPLAGWFDQYIYVLIISLIIVTGGYLALAASGVLRSAKPTGSPISSFMDRLPAKFHHATLYGVSSEDHYLRVHTSLGEALILMRLSDAITELGEGAGLQTHRSWWVASDGVAEVKSENGKRVLVLKSGAAAPVSRSFATAVKDAGFVK